MNPSRISRRFYSLVYLLRLGLSRSLCRFTSFEFNRYSTFACELKQFLLCLSLVDDDPIHPVDEMRTEHQTETENAYTPPPNTGDVTSSDSTTTISALRIVAGIVTATAFQVFVVAGAATFFHFLDPDEYSIGFEIIVGIEIVGAITSLIVLYLIIHSELASRKGKKVLNK